MASQDKYLMRIPTDIVVPKDSLALILEPKGGYRWLKKNRYVYRQGDIPAHVHYVLYGLVVREGEDIDSKTTALNKVYPGDWLGLQNAFPKDGHFSKYMYFARCQTDVHLFSVEIKDFLWLLDRSREFDTYIKKILARDYLREEKRALDLTPHKKVGKRLIQYLCRELERVHEKTPYDNTLLGTHQEIADAIGTSRETVTRELHCLRGAEITTQHRGKIIIADGKRLRQMACSQLMLEG